VEVEVARRGSAGAVRRYAELDGLRAVAVLLVFLFHAGAFLAPSHTWLRAFASTGWNGVYLFFVLSGFLVGGLALAEVDRTGTIDVRRFWVRRLLRTWPLYYVLLAVNVVRVTVDGVHIEPSIWFFLTFTQNLFPQNFFVPTWSLAVEEQFYLLLPLVLLGAIRARNRSVATLVVAVGLLGPWIVRAAAPMSTQLWAVGDSLVVGIAIAAVRRHRPTLFASVVAYPNALFLLGAVAVYAPMSLPDGPARDLWLYPGQAWGFGCIVTAALSGRLAVRGILTAQPAYLLAVISYSVYLTHTDVLFWVGRVAARAADAPAAQSVLVIGGGLVAAAAVGTVFYYLVEAPGMWLRDRLCPRA
jgi:peptidoglycan/LPS O-acetylase OafA/YrhL